MTIATIIVTFVAGLVIGALIVYKFEERTFTTMLKQTTELANAEKNLREEREDYIKTRAMFQAIDNVPEYLRDKYDISEDDVDHPEIDEYYTEIYN